MFTELAPLIKAGTSVHILIAAAAEGELHVTIMPQGQNAAINTPLAITAPPAELDEKLASTLAEYVGTRCSIEEVLENAKTVMKAAGDTAAQTAAKAGKKGVKAVTEEEDDLDEEGGEAVAPASASRSSFSISKPKQEVAEIELF